MINRRFQTAGQMSPYPIGRYVGSQKINEPGLFGDSSLSLIIRIILLFLLEPCARVARQTAFFKSRVREALVGSCWVYAFISSKAVNESMWEGNTCYQSLS